MNPFTRPLAIVLLAAASASAVHAVEIAYEPRVEVILSRADLAAAQAVLAQRSFETTYAMSTGRRMLVSSLDDSLRVRYGRRTLATLRHDGQGRFVSHDGSLSLRFELDGDGDPHRVRLLLPAEWQ